jgi:hypothetical protein
MHGLVSKLEALKGCSATRSVSVGVASSSSGRVAEWDFACMDW